MIIELRTSGAQIANNVSLNVERLSISRCIFTEHTNNPIFDIATTHHKIKRKPPSYRREQSASYLNDMSFLESPRSTDKLTIVDTTLFSGLTAADSPSRVRPARPPSRFHLPLQNAELRKGWTEPDIGNPKGVRQILKQKNKM